MRRFVITFLVTVRLGYFSGCGGEVVAMKPSDSFPGYEYLVDMRCVKQATEEKVRMGWWFTAKEIEEVVVDFGFPGSHDSGPGEAQGQ